MSPRGKQARIRLKTSMLRRQTNRNTEMSRMSMILVVVGKGYRASKSMKYSTEMLEVEWEGKLYTVHFALLVQRPS